LGARKPKGPDIYTHGACMIGAANF